MAGALILNGKGLVPFHCFMRTSTGDEQNSTLLSPTRVAGGENTHHGGYVGPLPLRLPGKAPREVPVEPLTR
jgi:hypothetical protein